MAFRKKKPGETPPGPKGKRPDVPRGAEGGASGNNPPGFDPAAALPLDAHESTPPKGSKPAGPSPALKNVKDDPFAPPSREAHFDRTMEDPDSSAKLASSPAPFASAPGPGGDPFAEPAPFGESHSQGDPFSKTVSAREVPDLPPSAENDPFGGDPFAPATPALPFQPEAPTIQLAPGAAAEDNPFAAPPPGDDFGAHERTMPLPPPGGNRNASHAAPAAPGAEENAMPANPPAVSLSPDKRRIGLALLAGGPITHERLLQELDRSGKSQSVLGKALLQSNFPHEEELLAVLVARVRIPKINVKNTKIPLETIKLLPVDVARRTRTLPIERIGDILVVVSPDIGDEPALSAVRHATGCLISPIQCAADGFDEILEGYYDRLEKSGLAPVATPSPSPDAAPGGGNAHEPQNGVLVALPADEANEDSWDKLYVNAGPISAEEAML